MICLINPFNLNPTAKPLDYYGKNNINQSRKINPTNLIDLNKKQKVLSYDNMDEDDNTSLDAVSVSTAAESKKHNKSVKTDNGTDANDNINDEKSIDDRCELILPKQNLLFHIFIKRYFLK